MNIIYGKYSGADKSLARPGRKQAATVKIVWAEEWIGLARVGTGGGIVNAVMNLQVA
jgi:hypothetical protein